MCTHITLNVPSLVGEPSPRTYVSARAMEMPGVIEQSLYVMPKGQQWPLPAPPPSTPWVTSPYNWTSTIDFVGIAPSGQTWEALPNFNDGLNASGVSVGALWLEPGTDYPTAKSAPGLQMSSFDFPAWVLGKCSSVGDVSAALEGTTPTFTVVVELLPTAALHRQRRLRREPRRRVLRR
jgi:penicillin V acylase-like amidase (Ntn superfamily)